MKEVHIIIDDKGMMLRLKDDQYEWLKGAAEEAGRSMHEVFVACFWFTMTQQMTHMERVDMALNYLVEKGELERVGEDGYQLTEKSR